MTSKRTFLFGVGVGALAGIFFAPHKGSKTRKLVANRMNEVNANLQKMKITATKIFAKKANGLHDKTSADKGSTRAFIPSSMQDDWNS